MCQAAEGRRLYFILSVNAQEYKGRGDKLAKVIHRYLYKNYMYCSQVHVRWHSHVPEKATETNSVMDLWDFSIQRDYVNRT